MITAYFWINGKCVEYSGSTDRSCVNNAKLLNYLCIDVTCDEEKQRYGTYQQSGWIHIPFADMPKELLAHVLLLT